MKKRTKEEMRLYQQQRRTELKNKPVTPTPEIITPCNTQPITPAQAQLDADGNAIPDYA